MVAQYKTGDRVKYRAAGAATSFTTGEVVDVLTETQPAGATGVSVKASEEEPRYLIRNDNTGKETAYKTENIIEKI